jgi:peptide/nickel transport system ATP-binding protein
VDIVNVENLNVSFDIDGEAFYAVADNSFRIRRGEILGIVGESGCGKSMTALSLIGLLPENAHLEVGRMQVGGADLTSLDEKAMRSIRGREISMIFQEPMTSLNPLIKVGKQIGEAVWLHTRQKPAQIRERVYGIMEAVGLPDAANLYNRYPHELSGGMRQRIMIAMAMVLRPKLLIADEPTTALDVTIQAQILQLMKALNQSFDTAIMFISHDFGVIKQMCDTIMVMYMGHIVEKGDAGSILSKCLHPYTKGMIDSIPNPKDKGSQLYCIEGSVPAISDIPKGCPFSPRCSKAQKKCFACMPDMVAVHAAHQVRCHLV